MENLLGNIVAELENSAIAHKPKVEPKYLSVMIHIKLKNIQFSKKIYEKIEKEINNFDRNYIDWDLSIIFYEVLESDIKKLHIDRYQRDFVNSWDFWWQIVETRKIDIVEQYLIDQVK